MQKAAIYVSNAERLSEGLLAGKTLAHNGMAVQILLTGSATIPASNGIDDTDVNRDLQGIQRFTNRLEIVGRLGFHHATLAQIAVMLKEADVVIPF